MFYLMFKCKCFPFKGSSSSGTVSGGSTGGIVLYFVSVLFSVNVQA